MTNAELIKNMRACIRIGILIDDCDITDDCYFSEDGSCGDCMIQMVACAADALEAADEKIADYIAAIEALDDSNDAYIKENEQLKNRIAELESQAAFFDAEKLNYKENIEYRDERIKELEDDLRNGTISNPERFKIYGYNAKDLILFAMMCRNNNIREEDMKQAAWNLELAVRAVQNERMEIVKKWSDETSNGISARLIPDFEKAFAEMRGEHDGTLD